MPALNHGEEWERATNQMGDHTVASVTVPEGPMEPVSRMSMFVNGVVTACRGVPSHHHLS